MTNINFPDSPTDNQVFGERKYNATKGVWEWYVLPGDTTAADLLGPGQSLGYDVEVLVVAGGGSGAFYNANGPGAGGGGGYLEGNLLLDSGVSYEITVGAGGPSKSTNSVGANGTSSSFSGALAIGGGGGGFVGAGVSGGSGGGGGNNGPGGSGTQANSFGLTGFGNDGADSGDGGAGGGGGGAGAAGGTSGPISPIRSNGGAGRESSISGSATTYATGGSYTFTLRPAQPQDGAPNTGDGGDCDYQAVSGAGGSGVVIFKISSNAAVSFGPGLVEANGGSGQTVGDYKVYTITAGTGTVTIS